MTLLILHEHALSTLILLSDERLHLIVDELGSLLAIGFVELLLTIIVADIGQIVTHTRKGYHAVSLFGHTLQVIHRTGRDASDKELLSSTSTQDSTHLVEHLLLGSDLSLLGQIPRSTERTATGHDGHLHQGVSILQMP